MNIEFANAFFLPSIYLYILPTPLLIYMHLETNVVYVKVGAL